MTFKYQGFPNKVDCWAGTIWTICPKTARKLQNHFLGGKDGERDIRGNTKGNSEFTFLLLLSAFHLKYK